MTVRRLALAAATVVAAVPLAVVLPGTAHAGAAELGLPDCVVVLAHAHAGLSAECVTLGPRPMVTTTATGILRSVYVTAETGAIEATLRCDGSAPLTEVVVAPGTRSFGTWGGHLCTLTLTALAHGTNGVGVSHGFYAATVVGWY